MSKISKVGRGRCTSNYNWIIDKKLAVGDWEIGGDFEKLKRLNIGGILVATPRLPARIPTYSKHGIYVAQVPIHDHPSEDISYYFKAAHQFINFINRKGKAVLVHCAAGRSRSVTLITSYLMKKYNWTPTQAIYFIRKRRPCEAINNGFEKQLEEYRKYLLRRS